MSNKYRETQFLALFLFFEFYFIFNNIMKQKEEKIRRQIGINVRLFYTKLKIIE